MDHLVACAYGQLATARNIGIILDTIWMALLSAVITTIVAFPIALYMTRTRVGHWRVALC